MSLSLRYYSAGMRNWGKTPLSPLPGPTKPLLPGPKRGGRPRHRPNSGGGAKGPPWKKFSTKVEKLTQYYSFSKTNVEFLIHDLESKTEVLKGSNGPNFEEFFDTFSKAVDIHCKLANPKSTKRNSINNPWITDSIIDAIAVKEELYDKWTSSKKQKEFSPEGDPALEFKFKAYRRCLKHVIQTQKKLTSWESFGACGG